MWQEIFKTGQQTDSSGVTRDWSESDLDNIVNKYNEQPADKRHEAPVVIGHPVVDSPAYGWVSRLKREGSALLAEFKQLALEFVEIVKEGRYKKVSMALYPDMLLRHVGFLGAVPPAVKGLEPVKFSEQKFNSFEMPSFEYAKYPWSKCIADRLADGHSKESAAKICAAIKNRTIAHAQLFNNFQTEKEAIDYVLQKCKDDKLFNYQLERFAEIEIEKSHSENISSTKQEKKMPENLTKMFEELVSWLGQTYNEEIANQTVAQLEKLKEKYPEAKPTAKPEDKTNPPASAAKPPAFKDSTEFKAMQTELDQLKASNKEMQFNEFFSELLKTGKVVPAQKSMLRAFYFKSIDGTLEFAEGDKTYKGAEALRKLIDSFPNQVEFNEIAGLNNIGDANSFAEQDKEIEKFNKNK
jgi:hypothetical protein